MVPKGAQYTCMQLTHGEAQAGAFETRALFPDLLCQLAKVEAKDPGSIREYTATFRGWASQQLHPEVCPEDLGRLTKLIHMG